ncbi:MAG: hypothetical protein F4187_00845 [Gemmatimonadetes bacterium]|nr:hypothetical protein [Gemmatimonadota bacterium]MYI07729.1 hypothetical protein [Gemmatimonadota bacterium]
MKTNRRLPGAGERVPADTRAAMRAVRRALLFPVAIILLAAPAGLQGQRPGTDGSDEAAFLRAVGEHFSVPQQEVMVLAQWKLAPGEIPVALFLAERAGVSPDVVISQRRRGEGWMAISSEYSVHAGDFHVRIDGHAGILADAYERFSARAASEWNEIVLSDDEVVGFVNLRFLSRHLQVSPERVARELEDVDGVVAVFVRLRSTGGP